jgi:two-component system response regulator RegA
MTSKNSIIVVDDDIVFCDALARSLIKRNYEVVVAYNLSELQAISNVSDIKFGIVDLRLGEDSGLKVIKYLLDANPDMNILMLTAYASIATTVEAIKLGAKNYLTKPASIEEILEKLTVQAASLETPIEDSHLSVKRLEWEHLQKVLLEHNGNVSAAARALNMHRRTLQRKLQKKPVKR